MLPKAARLQQDHAVRRYFPAPLRQRYLEQTERLLTLGHQSIDQSLILIQRLR